VVYATLLPEDSGRVQAQTVRAARGKALPRGSGRQDLPAAQRE